MDIKRILKENWQYLYFFLLTAVVFAGFIFSSKMLFGSDTVEAGIFFRSFYAEFVKTYHRIPLWNPYIFGGLPFVDAMHGDTFYPLAALQFLIPLYKALGYKLVVTVFLAGVFTYLYIRKMGMGKWAAVMGGTAYMLSGFLISLVYAGHDGRMYVTSLLPLLLYTFEVGIGRRTILWWWPFAVAFALLVMANHPQFAYFAMWCVGAYFLVRLIFILKEEKSIRGKLLPIVGFVLSMAAGLALSLVAIWPNQDYVRKYSPRSEEGRGYEYAASWSLHAEEAFSQLVPEFAGYSTLGGHPQLSSEQTYWGKNYFKINSEYAGLAALILGVIGLFIYRDRYSYFFLGTAIFALLYALGDSGFIFKIFYNIVPFVSKFRAPSTIMFLFCFAVAFLAARAIDQLEKAKKIPNLNKIIVVLLILGGIYLLKAILTASGSGIMRIYTSIFYSNIEPGQMSNLEANMPHIAGGFFAGAVFMAIIAIMLWAYSRKKITFKMAGILLLALIVVDSWLLHGTKFIRPVDPEPYFTRPAIVNSIRFFEKDDGPYRVFAMPQTLPNQNILAQFGIDQTTGYHGNQLRWYDNFMGGNGLNNLFAQRDGRVVGLSYNFDKILGLTNSRFMLMRQKVDFPGFEHAGTSPDGINIYSSQANLSRGRVVRSYKVVSDPDAALDSVLAQGFDFRNQIIIDRPPQNQIEPQGSIQGEEVVFLASPPDRIHFRATLNAPGFVALQDNWYPFWKAYENGLELPIHRADYTFMAVELVPGIHEIELRLENPKYIAAKNVTLVSWGILLAGLIVGIVVLPRRKKPAGE